MKILVVSQYYWPENYRITDIAESLSKRGHQVTVLTGLPNYQKGKIYSGYRHGKNRDQIHNGVHIVRSFLFARRKGVFSRFLNYWSFHHFASKKIRKFDSSFDVVFIYSGSPISLAIPGIKYAKRHSKKVLLYEMDLWPESLLAGGISKKSLIYKHYKKMSARIYSACDKILVSTKEHIEYISSLVKSKQLVIEYLPQYADSFFEESKITTTKNDTLDLMFAGNLGKAQSLEVIIEAASLLKEDDYYKFHIIGDGSERKRMEKLAKSLKTDNVIFYGLKPVEDMPRFYNIADVMLVSLENKTYANLTIPGKVQSYMAAGKPIIGSVTGSCARFIIENKIGYVCPSNDSNALVNLIKGLTIDDLVKKGKKAKQLYDAKYKKAIFLDRLVAELEILARTAL